MLSDITERIVAFTGDRERLLLPPLLERSAMEQQSYLREQADRCRRLARDSLDLNLKISLRKLADEYQLRADELENDEIFRETIEPRRSHGK